jgi:hypothetical protein
LGHAGTFDSQSVAGGKVLEIGFVTALTLFDRITNWLQKRIPDDQHSDRPLPPLTGQVVSHRESRSRP